MGPSFPLDLTTLPVKSAEIPSQYHSLSKIYLLCIVFFIDFGVAMGYSSEIPGPSFEERRKQGAQIEKLLEGEKEAAKAPKDGSWM